MSKILFIEDEFDVLKETLEYLIEVEDYEIEYEDYPTCNKFIGNIELLNNYDKICVDVKLHKDSVMDGVDFIKCVKDSDETLLSKIVIITAHVNIKPKLEENDLLSVKVYNKPIDFAVFEEILNC